MNHCQNCGQANAQESQFCRFCGTKILGAQPMPQENYDYGSPRPYAWKTDEYQTQTEARPIGAAAWTQPAGGPLAASNSAYLSGNYRCPNCMSQFLPRIEKRISTSGWITFAILLVVFFPLFWIGLLMKDEVHVCPSCNTRVK